jgi:hypothetical protein
LSKAPASYDSDAWGGFCGSWCFCLLAANFCLLAAVFLSLHRFVA